MYILYFADNKCALHVCIFIEYKYIKRWIIYVLTEEKKPAKEESESEDDDMGFGLFD